MLWRPPPTDTQYRAVCDHRQSDQCWLLLCKRFGDHTASGGVGVGIGDLMAVAIELSVQILEIAEAPGLKEVLLDMR